MRLPKSLSVTLSVLVCASAWLSPTFAAGQKATAIDREAMKQFETSMSRFFIRCGQSSYVRNFEDLYEIRGVNFSVGSQPMDAADVANGYEWVGSGTIYYTMRHYSADDGWGDWESGLVFGAGGRELEKRKGAWTTTESNWGPDTQAPIACSQIPKS